MRNPEDDNNGELSKEDISNFLKMDIVNEEEEMKNRIKNENNNENKEKVKELEKEINKIKEEVKKINEKMTRIGMAILELEKYMKILINVKKERNEEYNNIDKKI